MLKKYEERYKKYHFYLFHNFLDNDSKYLVFKKIIPPNLQPTLPEPKSTTETSIDVLDH